MSALEELLSQFKPPFRDAHVLYWQALLREESLPPILLYGAGKAGSVIGKKMLENQIPIMGYVDAAPSVSAIHGLPVYTPAAAKERLPDEYRIIVAINDYLLSENLYNSIQNTLAAAGLRAPYYIHEFSAGFVPDAHKIAQNTDVVKRACALLSDAASKSVFLSFLENIQKNFFYSMMYTNETYGIRRKGAALAHKGVPVHVKDKNLMLCCSTGDWDPHDPALLYPPAFQRSIFFYPIRVYRYKLRAFLQEQAMPQDKITILDQLLADRNGPKTIRKGMFLGGTALQPDDYTDVPASGIGIDAFLARHDLGCPGLIQLHMADAYMAALEGGRDAIKQGKPCIAVSGFQTPLRLCETVIRLSERLNPLGYALYLDKYDHENPTMGYCVYCVAA